MAQPVEREATEPPLEKSLRYTVPATRLFELLVSEEAAQHWMGAEVVLEPVAGGEVRVNVPGWPEVVGEVLEVSAPTRLVVRWTAADWSGPLVSALETAPDGESGSVLSLRETGFDGDDDLLRRRDWLWSHWLVRLAAAAARLHSGTSGSAR